MACFEFVSFFEEELVELIVAVAFVKKGFTTTFLLNLLNVFQHDCLQLPHFFHYQLGRCQFHLDAQPKISTP